MNNTTIAEQQQVMNDDYDRKMAELVKMADEKPTLRTINSLEAKPIEEWRRMYPELWLFIEVTQEDVHHIYEGKLIATAENSIEFLELGREYNKRHIVNYRTRGVSLAERPMILPILHFLSSEEA